MNPLRIRVSKYPFNLLRIISDFQRVKNIPNACYYATTIDALDVLATDISQCKGKNSLLYTSTLNSSMDVSKLTLEELDKLLLRFMTKNKEEDLRYVIDYCLEQHTFISNSTLKSMFRHYSLAGKTDMISVLQKYCAKVDPNLYRRNGDFLHYEAKAQCLRGNSEKGLSILKYCYIKYEPLRCFYRVIFRELIQDSVLNRSEASLVIFKKYVMEFSETWNDHYPLVCFWHICWSSTWFSDQMLSNELLETSETLRNIIQDKAATFSITALRNDYNEDAVVRLLQSLLKYKMMTEYAKVLQVLFSYKLKNRDIRGCTEILHNCKILDINLPSGQQGRYIKMLIDSDSEETPDILPSKNFELKF